MVGGTAAYTAYSLRTGVPPVSAAAKMVVPWPSARVLGASDRVRFGLIGAGGRGQEIFKAALRCANVEVVAVADLYTRRLDEARQIAPNAKTCRDFRELLDDKSI